MFRITMDDGFNPELVETAFFDGDLEIPCLEPPKEIIIPRGMIPFSKRKYSDNHQEFVVFYENDCKFGDMIKRPNRYVQELSKFPGVITPDNSVYVDSPLSVQIANVYRSRAIGCHFQRCGLYCIPNVRWGDERSYTNSVFKEKFAFLGLPKHSILSIGTYGCCKSKEEKHHLRSGVEAMLDELEPEIVLVYGAMPHSVFFDIQNRTRFINYPDWTSLKRRPDHGNK